MKRLRKIKPQKGHRTHYEQLWRVVDGAVRDAFAMHPDYISNRFAERNVRTSIVKRVTGAVSGFAVQAARGRSLKEAAEKGQLACGRDDPTHGSAVTAHAEGGPPGPPSPLRWWFSMFGL